MRFLPLGTGALLLALATPAVFVTPLLAQQSSAADSVAFTRQEVMIPMRDGTRLFTVVLAPARPGTAARPLPMLLQRTPYSASNLNDSPRFRRAQAELLRDGYIFVAQDIRGRFKSEGQFVMNRPPLDSATAARDPKATDESSDTYDTIDWLVRHVPDNNGRVGVLGISYPGWTAAMAGLRPHPALRAISPQAPLADGWMGDDFFHQGAFRQSYGVEYVWSMEASKDMSAPPKPSRFDLYDWYRSFPTLDSLARAIGASEWPTWRNFAEHPAYDSVWQRRALPLSIPRTVVPTLVVGGWWDQEDAYGPQIVYRTWEKHDSAGLNYFVAGPWYHGQWAGDSGTALGNLRVNTPTGVEYRALQARWLAHWLHGTGDGTFAEATVYDAGRSEWRTFDRWPAPGVTKRSLYFLADGRLGFEPPTANARTDARAFDAYVSDPAHPVPYRPRPVELTYSEGSRWRRWETEDQRFVDGRPDVRTWQTAPLAEDVTVAGDITARLFASTTGSDADWVVKLIDVYPDSGAGATPQMNGYQLMVAGDVLRGRYRESFERASPIPPNAVEPYTVDLHQQMYTFRRGHRIMVQVQSTWFPLYDRNPQTFVPNIFRAKPEDFRAQTHRIWRTARYPSRVELDVLAH
ncbi:MAG TPA: CocE/NonD family hydrolase [Gemmatimonadales bacterium]|nr:CocE/NonD family hydrolase [Gemmatimonadales bacterium]